MRDNNSTDRCPPRQVDNALDPKKQMEAVSNNAKYHKMFVQMQEKKIEHLARMTTSDMYRRKKSPHESTYFSQPNAIPKRKTIQPSSSAGKLKLSTVHSSKF